MIALDSILVPIDFADANARAFDLADSLAQQYGARLVLLHVVMSPPFVTMAEMERVLQDPAGYREEVLEKLHAYRSASPNTRIEHSVVLGDPIQEIVNVARDRKCGLIVMSTHGRTGLRRLLLGSVAEGVLRKAPCPVVTVTGPAVPEIAASVDVSRSGVSPVA